MSRFASEQTVPLEDLNQLDDWNKATIAAHLHKRFKVQRPYTSLGNIVVAVNPFEWLDLYDDDLGLAYAEPGRRDLPAHIYKSTAGAYRALLEGQEDQSILISGVSGAGKTETAKLLLGHLASVAGSEEGGIGSERIQHMVECTVVLESFGNAVMMGNNNSSRYGVVTQLQFDDSDIPKMIGSLNRTYLLEKSRVVSRSSRERNFHVFYQMVGSDDEDFKSSLHLSGKTSNDFKYLTTHAPAEDQDFTGLAEVQDAIRELGITAEEEKDIFKALGGLLHLGQLEFLSDTGRTDDASKLASDTKESLDISAELLGLSTEELSGALLTRPLQVAREKFVKPNKVGEAQAARDALAKDVYLGIFNYLLKKINEATSCTDGEETGGTISLIDIFGFESFRRNGFEQLLINYASEKLQQMFIQDVFKSVERLCAAEGIDCEMFMYRDNTTILETLEGSRGVLSMLDEECLLPHGTDNGFVSLLESYTQPWHRQQLTANSRLKHFTVHHYNHAVKYDADGFVERNRDKLHTSVAKLLGTSTNNMVKRVYAYTSDGADEADEGGEAAKPAENDFQARLAMFKLKETGAAAGDAARKGRRSSSVMEGGQEILKRKSMGCRFKGELKALVERIHSTEVQYILCIRPNMENNPVLFEEEYVTQQLLSASIVEAAQVYKFVGVNVSHVEFITRYSRLAPQHLRMNGAEAARNADDGSQGRACEALATHLLVSDADPKGSEARSKFEMGKTKIFIRGAEHEYLEEVMAFIERRCTRKIIRHWRARRARLRKAEAEEQRKARALAKEKARAESALVVAVDHDNSLSAAAPVSPVRTQPGDESDMSEDPDVESVVDDGEEVEEEGEEEGEEEEEGEAEGASPSDARVGANLSTPRVEPFTIPTMRAFLNQPVEPHTGVIECMIRRKKGVMNTVYQAFYEPTMKLLMTAKKDKGRYIIAMNPAYLKRGEPSTLGKVKAVAQRRQYIVYDNGFKANKTLPEKYTIKPERKEIAAVSIDLTRHDDFQGPRKLEVLVADSDEDVVDHASLLNSFGNDNTNIITPVPRMHSIKPEWDEDAGYFVLEFYKDRIKKQSVKNFMLHNSRGQFIMQFGRSKEDNVFALDFTGPFSPLAAFGVALSGCDSSV